MVRQLILEQAVLLRAEVHFLAGSGMMGWWCSSQPSGVRAVGQHWGVSGAGRAMGRDVPLLPLPALMTELGGEERRDLPG